MARTGFFAQQLFVGACFPGECGGSTPLYTGRLDGPQNRMQESDSTESQEGESSLAF